MSTAPRNPPFRAEHLGSLLRPSRLLNKRHAIQQNKESGADLAQLEDDSINEIVQVQNDCGIHSVSDGEYRRHMFWGTFFPTLNGMKEIFNPDPKIFREYVPDIAAFLEDEKVPGESVICDGKISHTEQSSYIGQFEYLKKIVPKERHGEIKMTLAAPNWYHLRYKEGMAYPKEVYSSDEEYFADIAKAYQTELQILYDAGLRN
ncbi:methionine synthase, partial [Hortaea werneckii]